ncbi:type II toxin-antitoxin system PemK/MazF family toxin [Actinotalea ferrariae]|uniref:type II toxin-antitoxin system PemK/MazF family toxin n=1 Tax=Actinotalea ferrariae TaxID=1386098 RepID=UPI00138DDA52|nr:type II toxin-antitoxin system PemK/MazF family toxin [Actinotalea ferrariae]
MSLSVEAGDLVLVSYPFSAHADEPYKPRPVLVVNAVRQGDETLLCAMVTSNERRWSRPKPGDIRIEEWQEAGLPLQSVIRTRRVWTAEHRDLIRAFGKVSGETLEAARTQLIDLITRAA